MTTTRYPLAIAHRFGNEVASLKAAEAAGADLVEADTWFYRGRIEIRHLKTMGPVPLLWDRWALYPASRTRLLLPDLLGAVSTGTEIMFDLKGTEPLLPEVLVSTLHELLPGRRYTVCSQSWDLLEHFHQYPDVRVAHSVGSKAQLARVWDRLTWHDHHMISIHRKLLSHAAVRALKERAERVITWPINTNAALEQVLDYGVDGFTSDNLELIREFVRERDRVPS